MTYINVECDCCAAREAEARVRAQVAQEIAEAIEDNVRNEDETKQDRGGYINFAPRMAYVAGHDKAAEIARQHGAPSGTAGNPEEPA